MISLKKLSSAIILFATLLIAAPSFAATATVDVDKLLFEYSKAKIAAEHFKTQEQGLQKTLIEAQNKIKATTSPVEKKNLESAYDKKLKAQAEKIKTEQLKKIKEIEDDIFKAIDKVNSGKYDLILKKSATVYCPNDITNDVLKVLNGTPAPAATSRMK